MTSKVVWTTTCITLIAMSLAYFTVVPLLCVGGIGAAAFKLYDIYSEK